MITLDRELAELRIQARLVFPAAVWLPGDDPPIGAVLDLGNGRSGVVLGAFTTASNPTFRHYWCVDCADVRPRAVLVWPAEARPYGAAPFLAPARAP